MEQESEKKTGIKGKVILLSIGLIGLGIGGYFAYRHFTKETGSLDMDYIPDETPSVDLLNNEEPQIQHNAFESPFPLKRGSKGEKVKKLQAFIARKYGIKLLGKGGIDGHFGRMTEQALQTNGLPTVITRQFYEKFTRFSTPPNKGGITTKSKQKGITVSEPKTIANELQKQIIKGRFDLALNQLDKLKTVKDYNLVNTFFKELVVFGVRKTIVTALLHRFTSTADQKKLTAHFKRIGLVLKADGKWSTLQGFNSTEKPRIKAIRQAKVWNVKGEALNVPINTILGELLHAQNGIAEFATLDDKVLFIHTSNIAYV